MSVRMRIAIWAGAFVAIIAATFGLYLAVGGLDEPEAPSAPVEARTIEDDVKAACRTALLDRVDDGFEWYSENVQNGVGSASGFRVEGTGHETVSGQRVGVERSFSCDAETVPGEGVVVIDVGFDL
jgi:hypothetical protein